MVSGIPKRGCIPKYRKEEGCVYIRGTQGSPTKDVTQSGMCKDVKPGPVVDLPSIVGCVCVTHLCEVTREM